MSRPQCPGEPVRPKLSLARAENIVLTLSQWLPPSQRPSNHPAVHRCHEQRLRHGSSALALHQHSLNRTDLTQDLGTFLAVYGALVDGDGTSWSIGGLPRTGILGSHNNYETDSSPLKSDLNQYGSNTRLIMSQFRNVQPLPPLNSIFI